jgi:hypothetical protein
MGQVLNGLDEATRVNHLNWLGETNPKKDMDPRQFWAIPIYTNKK